jgi:hypothetical protein
MHRSHLRRPVVRLASLAVLAAWVSAGAATGCARSTAVGGGSRSGPVVRDFAELPLEQQGRLARELTAQKTRVPGWVDEQRLAVGTVGNLRHSARARIVPYDQLERYKTSDFTDRWLFVATIDSDSSYAKLGIAPTTVGGAPNRLEVTYSSSERRWKARMITPGGASRQFAVIYEDHPLDPMPGTARWVWREDDESAWVMCGAGCCQIGNEL